MPSGCIKLMNCEHSKTRKRVYTRSVRVSGRDLQEKGMGPVEVFNFNGDISIRQHMTF